MDDTLLRVRRIGAVWMVEGARGLEPLLFLSGAKAEAQAHTFARSVAAAGGDARVVVHDGEEQLVGTFRYFASDASPPSDPKPQLGQMTRTRPVEAVR